MSRGFQSEALRVAVGLFCLLLGALMLVAPHKFEGTAFSAIETATTPARNVTEDAVTRLEHESDGQGAWGTTEPAVSLDPEALKPIWELEALGSTELFDELCALFKQDGASRMADIRLALSHQDVQSLSRLAHAMNGEALAWGATDLAEACRRLEDRAQVDDGPPLASLAGAVERLFQATLTALEDMRRMAA